MDLFDGVIKTGKLVFDADTGGVVFWKKLRQF